MIYRLTHTAIVFIIVLVTCSCISSQQARELFILDRNSEIGKLVIQAWAPKPIKVIPVDDLTKLYVYEYKDTGCRWLYTVDAKTERILSWRFISDPDLCYIEINYKGPW